MRLHIPLVLGVTLSMLGACAGDDEDGLVPARPDLGAAVLDAGSILDAGLTSMQPPCNPVDASGCPGSELCRLESVPTCVSAYAGVDRGSACRPGECGPTLACVRFSETATVAECAKLCLLETGRGCEGLSDYECLRPLADTEFGVCERLPEACDPYTQSPCPPSEACQPFLRRTGTREFRCLAAGAGASGADCGMGIGGCARGLTCVAEPDGSAATCRRYCQFSADCPEPEQCTGRVDDPAFTFCLP
ncbi:MAG: hypothetical protein AAFZ18_04490 [Myxococcota bacterium]